MPGERNSWGNLYSRLLRNYMRRPGGTSRRLGGQIGGFNTGRNQGPQGRDVANVADKLRAAVGNMGRVNRMRQRNPNRDWRTGHPMRRRRFPRMPGEVAGRSSAGGIRP